MRDDPAVAVAAQPEQHDGAEPVGAVLEQHLVERRAAPRLGPRCWTRQRADRVADQGGDDRGLDALAAHVAEGDDPVAGADLEDVVEVAADLLAVAGRAVGGRDVEARDVGGGGRDQRLLQGAGQRLGARLGRLGALLGAQQLALVLPALGGVEDRGPDHARARRPRAVSSTALTSTGSRLPSARTRSRAISRDRALHLQHRARSASRGRSGRRR